MRDINYQLWALGYDADGEPTDNEVFLGEGDPEVLREHAKKFKDTSFLPDYEDAPLVLEEGEFFTLCIETVEFNSDEGEDLEEETTDREDLWDIYQPKED
jgi:hypothetical protein